MPRESYSDLLIFIAVAREQSFTRAAIQLGISQSTLSRTVRALETRMGVRLLARTTRSVSPTEAGQRLMQSVTPRFQEIEAELAAVGELRDTPAGTIRITAIEHAAETVLWPALAKLLPKFPEIKIELIIEPRFVDIVTQRYDIGVRLGGDLAKEMTTVRIGPDIQFAIVGAPDYLARRTQPRKPQDLAEHECINQRLMSNGEIYAWELRKGKQRQSIRGEGQVVFNNPKQILNAALAGFGLGYVPEQMARPFIAKGRLKQVLDDWCPSSPGYHLYYPSHRKPSRAMAVVIDALRYSPTGK